MLENQEQDELNPVSLNIPEQRNGKPLGKKRGLFAALLVVVALLAIFLVLKQKIEKPFQATGKNQVFTVEKGEGFVYISRHLYNRGLISNSLLFDIYGYMTGQAGHVAVGDYVLSPTMSMKEILGVMARRDVGTDQNIARIREGWTIEDIADYLDKNNIISKKDFLDAVQSKAATYDYYGETPRKKSLEGYLFPDTYYFKKDATASQIIDRMLSNMQEKITPQMISDLKAQSETVYDVLTMASIIEKEVGRNTSTLTSNDLQTLEQERKNVSSVFYNRLRIGMPLQSDATVTYITKKNNPSASIADTKIDSPYNTYKYSGLPLGPISSPSLSSIEAAIYPAKTDFLYFLTKPDGTAVFAKTLDEQNANKAKYLK